ncbi:MAG TPA: IS30 family transposase [Gemmatimonadaceae bacterium]|nr:IS30 family transposase [Gemmatimonadaceae bacterium]
MGRKRFTRDQVTELWQRWHAGETLETISRALAISSGGASRVLTAAGGIRPAVPSRNAATLSRAEREVIERGLRARQSIRQLAQTLARAPSTISREIARNGARTGQQRGYQAATADARAWRAARRPKPCRLAQQPRLRRLVAAKLLRDWSPRQIAAWLRQTYPEDETMQVSAETIYQSLYVQARGVLRRELTGHLRRGQTMRRSLRRRQRATPSGIVDAIAISQRPPESADRAVPGHWEGDLLVGGQASYIATLVERSSRYVILVKVPSKDSVLVARALARRVRRLPAGLKASLTWDRGSELTQHKAFTLATQVAVYFCDPRSPWQRGSNENTNGLLRQYFPKGMDLAPFSQRQLDAIAQRLNTRPRETLQWQTPAARLATYVATTG